MKGPATPPLHQARLRQIAKLSSTELGFRIVVAVVILASVSFALWNFFKVMPPLQKRSRELASTAARLSSEVDDLDRKWRREQVVEITAKYGRLHDQLFGDAAAFQSWLANLNEQAAPLALDAKADFGKTTPVAAPGEKLAIIPATITVELRDRPGDERPLTPYQRLLQLSLRLVSEGRRADMSELSVTGGPASISHAVVVLDLWAGEEKPQ